MSVGDDLEERLQLVSLLDLLLSHVLGDLEKKKHDLTMRNLKCGFYLERVSVDSSNDGVWVRSVRHSFVLLLDDDGFASGILSSEDEDDLSRLHNLAHDYLKLD